MYKLLVVDDEQTIRTMLQDFFEDIYDVRLAGNGEEALRMVGAEEFDLVISDINMPGLKGPQLLAELRKQKPSMKTMLITAYNVDDYVRMAKEYSICNIIPKTVPFNFDEVRALIDGVLTGEVFGLERYLRDGCTIVGSFTIRSSKEGAAVREEVAAAVRAKFGSSRDLKLILDEIITNAIYHAPSGAGGAPKYREYTPVELDKSEYVSVMWGYDDEKYAVSVVDVQGRLTKETVLHKIDRHVRGEGMLDDSGRGIHMSRLFADRMVINIKRGEKTEVVLMNYFSPKYCGYRPLYINEV